MVGRNCLGKKMYKEEDVTRDMLNKIRRLQENAERKKCLLSEDTEEDAPDFSIAITDDPKFGQNTLTNQIEQFRSQVDSGAQFAKPDENNISESPLIFTFSKNPERGNNLIFAGVIPSLNNMKFQLKLRTSSNNGCFLSCNGLILNKDNLGILYKLNGFYENWREQWNQEASELEKMAMHIKNN